MPIKSKTIILTIVCHWQTQSNKEKTRTEKWALLKSHMGQVHNFLKGYKWQGPILRVGAMGASSPILIMNLGLG